MFLSPAEKRGTESGPSVKEMQAKIGQLALEVDFLEVARSRRRCERKAMIIKTHALPVKRQAELLEISRSNVYYLPVPTSEKDLALMRAIDELHLEYRFLGAPQLSRILARQGHPHAGRLHVGTLMAKMGITALYRKPNTSRRHPEHKVYPYLLRHLAIEQANRVWAMDITYLPMERAFLYLAAVMDWATRRVLAWRVSNTLTADFCVEAVEEAIARYGKPEIFNTDQARNSSAMPSRR